MKRRKISISILFIASYIILAIIAVSHHHHQDRICTEITHCFNESNQNHQHDTEGNTDLCIFKTIVTIPAYYSKTDITHFTLKFPSVEHILNPGTSLICYAVVIQRIRDQYPVSSTQRIYGIPGLRAPPIV